jgi:uncharacterized Tic20 family protein
MAVEQDRTLSIITHIMGICAFVFGALLVFLLTKDRKVKKHAINALNWQISLGIYSGILFPLSMIPTLLTSILPDFQLIIPLTPILSALALLNILLSTIAAAKASNGSYWKYPLSIDFTRIIGEKNMKTARKEADKALKEVRKII